LNADAESCNTRARLVGMDSRVKPAYDEGMSRSGRVEGSAR
jgi:hypothetical protein